MEELTNSKTSPVLKDDKYNAIIEVLKDPNACTMIMKKISLTLILIKSVFNLLLCLLVVF